VNTALVRLRYRPASDVLSGHTDLDMLPAGDPVTHSPDADTHLTWSPTLVDGETLVSFTIVHAAARSQQHQLAPLPRPLAAVAQHLITRGHTLLVSLGSVTDRAAASVDTTTRVPLAHLARPSPPGHAPADWLVEHSDITHTSLALALLADTLTATADRVQEHHAANTGRVAAHVRELSSVIGRSNGRTAPGTSAAARAALLADLPFEPHERQELLMALTDIDDDQCWPTVWALVDDLCASLHHSHSAG